MSDSAGLLADPAEARAILVACAKAGESITYSEMLAILGHAFTRPKMRALCKVLTVVDRDAEERGEPELAVLVVRQSDGLPGQGWWIEGAWQPAARLKPCAVDRRVEAGDQGRSAHAGMRTGSCST